jgi:hypothetical protein
MADAEMKNGRGKKANSDDVATAGDAVPAGRTRPVRKVTQKEPPPPVMVLRLL